MEPGRAPLPTPAHPGSTDVPESDDELIARTRAGDQQAFGELFVRYRRLAAQVAQRAGVSPSDVDDVIGDAFARVLRAVANGKGPDDNVAGYITTAVRRVAWRRNQERSREYVTSDSPLLDSVWLDELPALLRSSDIGIAFRRLPGRWQDLLWRIEVRGERVGDIASRAGKSSNAVSAVASRARRRLRHELAEVIREGASAA